MKFSCTQENLKHGLLNVSRVAGRNANLPILQNVLVTATDNSITLAATNLEIGVSVAIRGKVDQAGTFTLPAQLFTSYIGLVSSDKVDCELVENEFRITANGQATAMKGEDAGDFPILPEFDKTQPYSMDRLELEQALQQTVIAAAIDESRPEIAGVCFTVVGEKLTLASTDSYRLAERVATLTQTQQDRRFIVPQRAATELLRLLQANLQAETVQLFVSDNQFASTFGDVTFVSRLVEGKFPEYEQIIPREGKITAVVGKEEFVKAVKGAALFSKAGVNDISLNYSVAQQHVLISAVNAQVGKNTITLPAAITGEDLTIVFNYRYLLDGAQNLPGSEVKFTGGNSMSPGGFTSTQDDRFLYVVMPIKQ